MSKVAVLLSTYNGEKYLVEQLNSIISQDYDGELTLYIRDDGSSDKTISIVEEFISKKLININLYAEDNVGPIESFFKLLEYASDYDYYAFCDQDDVWDNDKIAIGINSILQLESESKLYCSSLNVVDDKLNFIRTSFVPDKLTIENAIIESSIAGCTMILNKSLREVVLKSLPLVRENRVLMHDAWILKLALIVGSVYCDKNSHIKYRQHSSNVVGASTSYLTLINRRIRNIQRSYKEHSMVDEAHLLKSFFFNGDSNCLNIDISDLETINNVCDFGEGFLKRISALSVTKVYRNRVADKFIFYIMVVFGFYNRHI